MITQIKSINPFQAAKLLAAMYIAIGVIFIPLVILGDMISPNSEVSIDASLLAPFEYAAGAFLLVPILCWLYNIIAERIGGIEVTLGEVEPHPVSEIVPSDT